MTMNSLCMAWVFCVYDQSLGLWSRIVRALGDTRRTLSLSAFPPGFRDEMENFEETFIRNHCKLDHDI